MAVDALYLLDSYDDSTLSLSDGTDGFRVAPEGFIPSTCDLRGGTETIRLVTVETANVITDEDEMEDAFTTLKLWLERARQRYGTRKYYVYLCYKPAGRTFTRRARIKQGTARKAGWQKAGRDGALYFEPEVTVDHGPVELSESFTMKNLVKNPSFEYDTNGDGVADNWTFVGSGSPQIFAHPGTPHGRSTQRQTAGIAGDYFQCDNISVTAGQKYRFSVWYILSGASGDVWMQIYNAAGPSLIWQVFATTYNEWTRMTGTVTIPGGCTDIFIRLLRNVNTSGCHWDMVLFQLENTYGGSSYDTGMWSDYYVLNEHDDWEWDNTNGEPYGPGADQNSTHRDILDVLGIPGDLAPDLLVKLYTGLGYTFDVPRVGALSHPEASKTWLSYQAESGTLYNDAALATDAGASGPSTNNCVRLPLAATGTYFVRLFIDEDDALRLAGKLVRAVAIMANTSSPGADYVVEWGLSRGINFEPAEYFKGTLLNTSNLGWTKIPGPTFVFPQALPVTIDNRDVSHAYMTFWAKQASALYAYLDRIILVPLDGYLEGPANMFGNADYFLLMGDEGMAQAVYSGADAGKLYRRFAGAAGTLNRYKVEDELRLWISAYDGPTYGAPPATPTKATLLVRPRYSTL